MSFIIECIDNDFKGYGLPNKIIESIFILLGIAGYHKIKSSFYNSIFDKKIKIKTFYLLDLSVRQTYHLHRLIRSKRNVMLSKMVNEEIDIIDCTSFHGIFSSIQPL